VVAGAAACGFPAAATGVNARHKVILRVEDDPGDEKLAMNATLRVLMVEDSATDAKLVVRELQQTGRLVEFERVETAEAMRASLERNAWDVVISDWSMPKFSALAALGILREKRIDIPFIVVSGTIGEETAVDAMRAGAHDFVHKDKFARLTPAVDRELRECKAREAHRQSDEALRRGAHEKTVMLQEIHHRVKNNLQMISSLLNFQMEHVKNPETRAILQVTQTRINSIAHIHEKLYQSPLLATVDMGEYTRGLVAMLMQTHVKQVLAEVRAVDVVLPVDLALPCGLILSELVTNALKHAFPGPGGHEQRPPAIVIDLRRDRSGFVFSVADNGVGARQPPSAQDANSLGLRLVGMFVEQLRGTIVISLDEGTRCTVAFPAGDTS
jgi:two-component sensor histidine kinase